MAQEPSPRLLDVMVALYERGEEESLIDLHMEAGFLSVLHGVEMEELLEYDFMDYLELYKPPVLPTFPPPRGGGKFWYGEAAFPSEGEEDE